MKCVLVEFLEGDVLSPCLQLTATLWYFLKLAPSLCLSVIMSHVVYTPWRYTSSVRGALNLIYSRLAWTPFLGRGQHQLLPSQSAARPQTPPVSLVVMSNCFGKGPAVSKTQHEFEYKSRRRVYRSQTGWRRHRILHLFSLYLPSYFSNSDTMPYITMLNIK